MLIIFYSMSTYILFKYGLLSTGYWPYGNLITDEIKQGFLQILALSVLLYSYTTCTFMKHSEKNLDKNYTRMLHALLNKSWKEHPTKQQLCSYLPLISHTIQVRQSRHVGHYKLRSDVVQWIPTYGHTNVMMSRKLTQISSVHLGCCQEELQKAMSSRYRWQERVKGNCAVWYNLMMIFHFYYNGWFYRKKYQIQNKWNQIKIKTQDLLAQNSIISLT